MFMCMDMNNGAAVVDILVEYFVRFVLGGKRLHHEEPLFIQIPFWLYPRGRRK